jgi:hypothetical protein
MDGMTDMMDIKSQVEEITFGDCRCFTDRASSTCQGRKEGMLEHFTLAAAINESTGSILSNDTQHHSTFLSLISFRLPLTPADDCTHETPFAIRLDLGKFLDTMTFSYRSNTTREGSIVPSSSLQDQCHILP